MVITKLALPRRTFIRGIGATVALPFLDAMVPAMRAQAKAAPRFTAIYCGNGANMFDWTPPTEGVGFTMSPSLTPLEPFRDRLVVFTGLDNFQATDQGDVGGQHPRAAPAFMSCAHPKQTEGADVQAGTTIDQMIAERICRDTKLPSLEVSVDRNDVVGACDHGYSCAYMNSMSWKTPTTPLPSETNPRFVFERMFGIGATAEERLARAREDRSILDALTEEIAQLRRRLGASDRTKLAQYFDAVRDVEQRIVKAESTNSDFSVPEQPVGVPEAHHSISHHGNNPEKMKAYTKLNTYHVETLTYYLNKLKSIPDGDGNLLDSTVVLFGSGMSDGNVHNNYNVPVILVGGQALHVKGNRHVKYPKGTPLANLMLGVMDRYGVQSERFGDSTSEIDLSTI